MFIALEIILIASFTSMACCLVGCFLVAKDDAMTSDSITHTVLLGIVIGFIITYDLSSPVLIICACCMGLATVIAQDSLQKTKLLSSDASISLVYPLFFSIAILLISTLFSGVHLDTDAVLLGQLVFAPLNRLVVFGIDIGAKSIYLSLAVLVLNLVFIKLFYSPLTHSAFDYSHAKTLSHIPVFTNYILMLLVSASSVVAFESVGSVLVVAVMIIPSATAYLLSRRFKIVLVLACMVSVFASVAGYAVAFTLDCSLSGSIATILGAVFFLVLTLSPRGVLFSRYKKLKLKKSIHYNIVLLHLYKANSFTLYYSVNLSTHKIDSILYTLKKDGLIIKQKNGFTLTLKGKDKAICISNNL